MNTFLLAIIAAGSLYRTIDSLIDEYQYRKHERQHVKALEKEFKDWADRL